jgi:Mlc titration factor MtfA (ptsG expression regulator)
MFPLVPPQEPDESKRNPEAETFPKTWRSFLRSNVFHYRLLSKAERKRLRRDTRILIVQKTWEGCKGLAVTDEMKVTIAAQACLMLLGREHDHFARVPTILVYPSGFQVTDEQWHDAGWQPLAAGGLAVYRGPVILAWDAVLAEGRDPSAGRNLVIHEFAHQLDYVDGYADGTLDLVGKEAERWQTVMSSEYQRLCRAVRKGRQTFLGDYAATSKTEFFATTSERFFTRPEQLLQYHLPLYQALSAYYAVNPLRWFAKGR